MPGYLWAKTFGSYPQTMREHKREQVRAGNNVTLKTRLPVTERHSSCSAACEVGLSLFQKFRLERMCPTNNLLKSIRTQPTEPHPKPVLGCKTDARCHLSVKLTGNLDLCGKGSLSNSLMFIHISHFRSWLVSCLSAALN